MGCLFAHKWVTTWQKTFVRSLVPYRRCIRCGVTQWGIHDTLTREVSWEAMRERTYFDFQQARIVRKPSSGLDQLAHTLRLRRTRAGDRVRSADTRR